MIPTDPDIAQRQAADGTASVWVAASAGTGKTKVLTDRVIALMLNGSAPSRILCLTFTKAAAAEMANRINERLSRWTIAGEGELVLEIQALTGQIPDQNRIAEARRLFARVLDAPGGMKIMTIHAFCQSLLRRFPIEAGVPPHFEVMDERSADEALAVAREEVLATAHSGKDPGLSAALARVTERASEQGFLGLLGEVQLERARLARAIGTDSPEKFMRRLAERLDLSPEATPESVIEAACSESAFDAASLRLAAGTLAGGTKTDVSRGEILATWLADPACRIAGFDEYLKAYFTKELEPRASLMTKGLAGSNPLAVNTLEKEAERLGRVLDLRASASLLQETAALVRIGQALLKAYERQKAARALLDYEDLVLKSAELLQRPGVAPWVLFKLDGGLDHILIDEAQDTNPEQWLVVRQLAEEFFVGEGARQERRTIFAVGDAKQSIYSFQRANPRDFLAMRDHFKRRAEEAEQQWRVVDLATSFRSTDVVLQTVDRVFAQAEAKEGVALDGAEIAHAAFRQGHAGLVELWPPVEPDEPPAATPWEPPVVQRRTTEPRARLAQAIAGRIAGWIGPDGERLHSRGRRIAPGDIMVLLRRRGPFVTDLVRALKQADVPVAGVDRMLLTDQLAVQDMVALGHFLLLPEDDLTLATVLKGPLFGIDEETLFHLAYRRPGTLWNELRRRAGDHPALDRASRELSELLGRADFAPPYELFAEVLGARRGRFAMLGRLGAEATDPIEEFLSIALAYEQSHIPSLQGFLHWLETGEAEVKRDLDQRGRDEVRILTVHGSKGLQAPIVFLPDTLQTPIQMPRLFWTEDGMPLWHSGGDRLAPTLGLARTAVSTRRDEEYRRLLYVALTRAEDRLYVCGWQGRKTAPAGCWYNLVAGGLGSIAEKVTFDLGEGVEGWRGEGFRLTSIQSAKPKLDDRAARIVEEETPLPDWATRPPDSEPAPPRPLAPSRPTAEEPPARSPLGTDQGQGFRRGLLVHRLLQSLPELPGSLREDAARRFLARPVHDLEEHEQASLLGETLAVLNHPEFSLLFGPQSRAEVPVVGLVGAHAISGQIDRLVVTDDSVLIVDYKTLRPPPLTEEEVPSAYLTQLAAYRAALAQIYPAHEIRCALLWTDGPRLMPISPARLAGVVP